MLAEVIRQTDAEEEGNAEMRQVPGNVAANECGEFKNFPAIFNRFPCLAETGLCNPLNY